MGEKIRVRVRVTLATIRAVETLGCLFSREGIVGCPHHERTVDAL